MGGREAADVANRIIGPVSAKDGAAGPTATLPRRRAALWTQVVIQADGKEDVFAFAVFAWEGAFDLGLDRKKI